MIKPYENFDLKFVTVFAYGKFDPDNTVKNAWAVVGFGYGLVFFSWVKVLVSAYYLCQDTRTPVCAMLALVLMDHVLRYKAQCG